VTRHVLAGVPAARFATAEEVAESAVFLLSDRASYVTGEVLVVDGGQWLGKSVYTTEASPASGASVAAETGVGA
jgi:NAD(P)-dependent dehydrogenase (short-subunit alcohol dehydrogenase family)